MAASAAILVLVALAAAGGMARLWEEQRRARSALLKTQEARARERQALLFNFAASDEITGRALARIAKPASTQDPDEPRRDEIFCREALGYYEEIAGRYRDDNEMRAIVAAADHRVGFIRMILNQPGAEEAYRRSVELYEGLLASSPGSRDLRSGLAQTYGDLAFFLAKVGQPEPRLKCLERLIEIRESLVADFPAERDFRISLSYFQAEALELLGQVGRTDEAKEVRRRLRDHSLAIAESDPANAVVRNNLAWLLVSRVDTSPRDAAQAVELAKEAVAIAPKLGVYWNTLGVAHYRAGDASAAVAALASSMRLRNGGDPYDWFFLAMAHQKLGNHAESVALVRPLPRLDPGKEVKRTGTAPIPRRSHPPTGAGKRPARQADGGAQAIP